MACHFGIARQQRCQECVLGEGLGRDVRVRPAASVNLESKQIIKKLIIGMKMRSAHKVGKV